MSWIYATVLPVLTCSSSDVYIEERENKIGMEKTDSAVVKQCPCPFVSTYPQVAQVL